MPPPPLWDAEHTRGLLDFVDKHKGPEGLFMTNLTEARVQAAASLHKAFPNKDPGVHSGRQIEGGVERMIKKYGISRDIKPKHLYERGSMLALDYAKMLPGTYSDDEIQAWRAQPAVAKLIAKEHERRKVGAAKRKIQYENEYDNEGPSPSKRRLIREPVTYAISTINKAADLHRLEEMKSWGELKSVTNKEHIKDCMKDLCGAINLTVRDYLEENGIETVEPLVLDFEPRGQELRQLIDTVAGSDDRTPGDHQSLLTSMQRSQCLTTGVFIRALVMAAVTKWALMPSPLGVQTSTIFEGSYRWIKAHAPDAATRSRLHATGDHLDNIFQPAIDGMSEEMAHKLNRIIMPLLSPRLEESEHRHEIALQTAMSAAYGSTNRRLHGLGIDKLKPEHVRDWVNELTRIFRNALDMRRVMEYQLGKFAWDLPRSGTRFNDATMIAMSDTLPHQSGTTGQALAPRRVFITLAPGISVSDQMTYAGGYEPQELVCPAIVIGYTPRVVVRKSTCETIMVEESSNSEESEGEQDGGMNGRMNGRNNTEVASGEEADEDEEDEENEDEEYDGHSSQH